MATNSPFESGWQKNLGWPAGSSDANPTFASFLEDEPRAAFFAGIPRGMTTGAETQRRVARDIYPQALSEFYGALGEQIMSGNQPTLKFTEFLKQNPYAERMAAMGRQQAGHRQQQFSPRARYLYY